jgi:hypothetical protein
MDLVLQLVAVVGLLLFCWWAQGTQSAVDQKSDQYPGGVSRADDSVSDSETARMRF